MSAARSTEILGFSRKPFSIPNTVMSGDDGATMELATTGHIAKAHVNPISSVQECAHQNNLDVLQELE